MKKITVILLLLGIFLFPSFFIFAQVTNSGFVSGNIWYSRDPFKEGDKIRIYTIIFNPDDRQLSGSVFFFDKTTFLGNKAFTIPGNSLKDISIEWTATAGNHTIFGQIQNAKYLNSDSTYENANLAEVKTAESSRTVAKTTTNKSSSTNEEDTSTAINISSFIKDNTPEVVSTTIDSTTNAIENFRQDTATNIDTKKEEIQKEIDSLKGIKQLQKSKDNIEKDTTVSSSKSNNVFIKPFKYTELFALSLFSTIFNNRYIFYGLIVLVLFFVFRYIIRKFF